MRKEFEHIRFEDGEQSARRIESLLAGADGLFAETLSAALAQAAEPDTVLVRLERFLDATFSPQTQRDLMAAMPRYLELIVTLFDQSHYLTDIACRNPEFMTWLWQEAELDRTRTRNEMVDELLQQMRAFDSFEARCASMRRYKRREFLRIAARDVFAHAPLPGLVKDLTNLAEAGLAAAIEAGEEELHRRYGRPRAERAGGGESTFVVLGLGKLGGRELNFSSDIDLIFVYSEEGQTSGGESGALANSEYFSKLGERIIKALHEVTDEGHVFRVDMRLRPYGRTGPLAVSIDTAIDYYERAGQAWERQALIKTRPVAGDLDLGRAFIRRTRPFVFPRYFDDETLEDIREVKQQMEAQIRERGETELEVKLGRGGIRDIEFTVQMLQMLNGGRIPALRLTNTLDTIKVLGRCDILRPFEADTLTRNYMFMRRVEHRLQIEGSQQRHALPAQADALDVLARRLGYAAGASFLAEYRDRADGTREILERFLASKGAGHLWVTDLLNPQSEGDAAVRRLAAMGFHDPAKARQEVLSLSMGPAERPHTLYVRQRFAAVTPTLLKALAQAPDPDATLLRLAGLLTNLRAPGAIFEILHSNPQLCGYLVRLVANSEFLTELLMRDPGLFDTMGASSALERSPTRLEQEERLGDLLRAYDPEAAPFRFVSGELVRIGMRDLFTNLGVRELGEELTQVAEVCLAHVLDRARARVVERFGETQAEFAVLGLGKLGGRELGYGSDLDLVFVFDDAPESESAVSPGEYFAALASQTLRTLKEPTRYGILYDVDARLRPDGNKGVLAVNAGRLREYYLNEAQAWERLALMKARAVAGDTGFMQRMDALARDLAFGRPLSPEDLAHIDEIRRKIAASATPLDVKKDEGGIVELEFAVRLLQLRYAADAPELRRADVLGAIDALQALAVVDPENMESLRAAYGFLRRIENRLRMMNGRSGSALPESPEARADLARRLGIEGDLLEQVSRHKANVHAQYIRALEMFGAAD